MPVFVSHEREHFEGLLEWLNGEQPPTPERYMRGMTFLELCWRQAIPTLSLTVEHDEPRLLPGSAIRTAMAVFAALRESEPTRRWFVSHIHTAVVHCAIGDAIAVVGNSIHFFKVKELDRTLGTRLYDQLSSEQQRDFERLTAGRDPRREFSEFVERVMMTHGDEDHLRGLSERFGKWVTAGSFDTLRLDPDSMGESPEEVPGPDGNGWSEQKNARRRELIDKKIQRVITPGERAELDRLQQEAIAYRDRVTPLPIEAARRVHEELLRNRRSPE